MNEFELIQQFFQSRSVSDLPASSGVRVGIGDDCAVLGASPEDTVISTDTLVEGRHFPADCRADIVAGRALGSSASDLAAMGARPLGFTLALSLPSINEGWLAQFSQRLSDCAGRWHLPLIGGDTVRGPLVVTMTVLGRVVKNGALLRHGASEGDDLWVSGHLGDAAGGLAIIQDRCPTALTTSDRDYLLQRYRQPEPRLLLGSFLVGVASAAIDVSDGLLADAGHILRASGRGARLDTDALPVSQPLINALGYEQATTKALTGGDDYELCFTAPVSQRKLLTGLSGASQINTRLSRIGTITTEPGLKVIQDGQLKEVCEHGFDHFRFAKPK